MTVPPVPRRRPALVPRGSPTVVPDPQTQRAHPCRFPSGKPAERPPGEAAAVRFSITPLGGAGRSVTRIVDAIVRYLKPGTRELPAPGVSDSGEGGEGPAHYYADGGEEPGRWRGRGARAWALVAR